MKASRFLKVLKLTKTTLSEYKNWGEGEIYKAKKIVNNQTYSSDNDNDKEILQNDISVSEPQAKYSSIQSQPSQDTGKTLEALKEKLKNCKDCPLGEHRLNCVFGEGDSNAKLMFIGEGPGYDEDHQGRPFIGRAGQLLTKIIEAMGYQRQEVYITNIVKCHPMKEANPELRSNDRPPLPEETSKCKKYLDMQIDIIKPKIIITLGAPSSKTLLNSEKTISDLRGEFFTYNGITLMPTYHPAALLRNPSLKKPVWEDMKKVIKFLKEKGFSR
ncbi:MAG: uracil-DNA glycosylase [Elusimicrobiota bacterium]|jgi:DNA polymerase|nr:uracil-DNA glycosylase [Elusimicrobiota bacterium]